MIEAYLAGRNGEAAALHLKLQAINKALFLQPNPVPVKRALQLCGFDAGALRAPLKEASPEVTGILATVLAGLGLAR